MTSTLHTSALVSLSGQPDAAIFFGGNHHLLIRVSGIVQGVGFRPFVYRLARSLDLSGSVRNHSGGVEIHVEGDADTLRKFLQQLVEQAPPAALITGVESTEEALTGLSDFRIVESETRSGLFTQVSADLALCDDCRRELLDSNNRRYRYPFINCTNCGPRFTIIRGVPYDRPDTTMMGFKMCPTCADEYRDPQNRRYHAQPVACPECGPQLSFWENAGDSWQHAHDRDHALLAAVHALQNGRIVLIQGIGGFHLAGDARSAEVVRKLRRRKRREEKPFAVMFPSVSAVKRECVLNEVEQAALTSVSAPIVLLKRKSSSCVAEAVAPRNPLLGALLPYSPLHVLLMDAFKGPLVMTSANFSEEPILYELEAALRDMRHVADAALVHDRPIHMFADDSIVRCVSEVPRVLRRARGYVPKAIEVAPPFRVPVLAFGADMKNTFCLGSDRAAILSPHLGDLESEAAVHAEQAALDHYLRLFGDHVRVVACDLHPDYSTTRLAEEWSARNGVPLIRAQHHHAHLAACLAENHYPGPAVGLCLDGTGYGTDGTIWGGEVLIGDFNSFTRVGHLRPVPMPGGEAAAREPWRMAVSWLRETCGDSLWSLNIPLIHELLHQKSDPERQLLFNPELMARVYLRTSSAGRLFDALSALLGFGLRKQFEGQAAMELECLVSETPRLPYAYEIERSEQALLFDPRPMFAEVVQDLQRGIPADEIAGRAHETIARAFSEIAIEVAKEAELQTICLSGGCLQNAHLLARCEESLSRAGLRVLTHREVPANDGGISLGQACIAIAQAE
jgi:hydrogenase maturation protein HypF